VRPRRFKQVGEQESAKFFDKISLPLRAEKRKIERIGEKYREPECKADSKRAMHDAQRENTKSPRVINHRQIAGTKRRVGETQEDLGTGGRNSEGHIFWKMVTKIARVIEPGSREKATENGNEASV